MNAAPLEFAWRSLTRNSARRLIEKAHPLGLSQGPPETDQDHMAEDRPVYSGPLAAALFSVSPGQWDEEVLRQVCPESRRGAGRRGYHAFQLAVRAPVSDANNIQS